MWHRIVDGQIVESVPAFGDDGMNALTPGELRERFGWVRGVEAVKPVYDADTQDLALVAYYDPISGTVTEQWRVVPVDTNSPVYIETPSRAERRMAREYQDIQTIMAMTPQEVADLVDTVFPGMTAPQRRLMRALAVICRVVGKRTEVI